MMLLFALLAGLALAQPGSAGAQVSEAELETRFQMMRSKDPKARHDAAQAVASLPAAPMEALVKQLLRPRATPPETYRALFLEMGAQVPNWSGSDPMWVRKPDPPWVPPPRARGQPRAKRPPSRDPEKLDWMAALSRLDLDKAELVDVAGKELARAEALEVVALLHALAASRRLDAVEPIFRMAFEYEGAFRDECGRQIRGMESYAIPSLIRLMHTGTSGKQRRYASYQLDRMDRARPARAISQAPDDHLRAEIIHAYGEVRAQDAVEAILNQVDAPSHRVRKQARWAWLRYVTGKEPPPAPTRKRKLPGGKEEEEEKPDYLTYREIATLALERQLQEIRGQPTAANVSAKQLTDELFAYYDHKHAAEWDAQFGSAQAKERSGELEAAVSEFGWILAHDPSYARRAEMAPALARFAEQLERAGDRRRALGFYRQAADLDANGPEVRRTQARIAYLDALEALDRGYADTGGFRRALALDPSLGEARAALRRTQLMRLRHGLLVGARALLIALPLAAILAWLWRRAGPQLKARS